jgi:hypothetical protein
MDREVKAYFLTQYRSTNVVSLPNFPVLKDLWQDPLH